MRAKKKSRIPQGDIAQLLKISAGHFSDIFTGKKPVGVITAKKLAKMTPGIRYTSYLHMPAGKFRKTVQEIARKKFADKYRAKRRKKK